MTPPDAGNIVQDAFDSGRIDEGRERLDAWQASQPLSRDTFTTLRYYRAMLGQNNEAIDAAKSMIELPSTDEWERMSDHLQLGELYVGIGDLDSAWDALSVVLEWPELKDAYSVGMVRYTVELALDISATAIRGDKWCEVAFDAAVRLLDDGCSTSFAILQKARDCSERLGRGELFERFKRAAAKEFKEIERQLKGR